MAFEAEWFHQNVKYLQTAGEDKELEAMLLQQRIYTVYLPDLLVFDEKTQKKEAISNQRKRWIAAQFGALRASLPYIEPMLWQQRMDDSHQMVDIVGCTSSGHDATRTGRQTIYQTGRESNHQNAYAGCYYDW